MNRTCLAVVALFAVGIGCGPKSGPAGPAGPDGEMPAAVTAYAGLRWVPGDATYALATRRTEDAIVLARHLFDALGIVGEFDTADVQREMSAELGVDLLSADGLAALGVDLERGVAIWSRGLGPNLAVPLADPQRVAGEIERRRGAGVVVQTSRAHDTDVYTWRPGGDAALHWAIAGDWLLVHIEVMEDREPDGAWFEAAWTAGGALAGHADFTAALAESGRRVGPDAPLVGLLRVAALTALPQLAGPLGRVAGCASLVAPIERVFVSGSAAGNEVRGSLVLEVGAAVDDIRRLITPRPAGWAAARQGAPAQIEIGLDLHAASRAFAACTGEDVAQEERLEIRAARVFVQHIDLRRMDGKGAGVLELLDPKQLDRMVDGAVGDIPGLRFLTKKRTVAGVAVTAIEVPAFPAFAYGTSGTTGVVAIGGLIDVVLAGGIAAGGDELARLSLAPRAWSAETWDEILREVIGRDEARAELIGRLRAWSLGEASLTIEGRALVLTAHGVR